MGKIRFGVIIPRGWLNDLPKVNSHKQFETARNVAIASDKLGFASVWAYDRFMPLTVLNHWRPNQRSNASHFCQQWQV